MFGTNSTRRSRGQHPSECERRERDPAMRGAHRRLRLAGDAIMVGVELCGSGLATESITRMKGAMSGQFRSNGGGRPVDPVDDRLGAGVRRVTAARVAEWARSRCRS